MKIKKIILIFLIIIFLIIFFLTFFAIINSTNNKIIKGVSIQSINVSGYDKENVENNFQKLIDEKIKKEIILKYNNTEINIKLEEFNVNYQFNDAIEEACKIGREGNIIKNNLNIIKTFILNKNINIEINYDEEKINQKIDYIMSILPNSVVEYSYYVEDEELIITKGKDGIKIDNEKLIQLLKEEIENLDSNTQVIEIPVYEKKADEINLEKIYSEIYKQAEDAYITQDPLTVHPNVNGVDFAITMEEAKALLQEDKEEYVIPLKITVAEKTVSDLGEDAFPNILGTFTTRYDASNLNRSNNLLLASEKINGTVVMPGEVFSYNQIVGKRTIDAGYKEAGAYAGGQVVQEVGGGICQVSSTLYNAVLYANLEIVERSNHYFETSYVAAGRDATVSWGTVDFKFKNNRNYPIKVEATTKNGITKISILGIKEDDDYDVVIQTEVTSIVQMNTKYETDYGATDETVKQEGHNGCTSKTYKILTKNGVTVSTEEISSDYYHALDRIIIKANNSKETENTEDDEFNNIINKLNSNLVPENLT